jgi:hypothetical protein
LTVRDETLDRRRAPSAAHAARILSGDISGPESAAHLAVKDRSSPMPSITTDNASVTAPT